MSRRLLPWCARPFPANIVDMSTVIVHSAERSIWPGNDIRSRQSFAFTGGSTPRLMAEAGFGALLVHNDDLVEPGEGFDMHRHRDSEIVTWVLEGRLRHRDSRGTVTELGPGEAEAISAGRGIAHAETNAAGFTSRQVLRVVQMWLPTDRPDHSPTYRTADFSAALTAARDAPDTAEDAHRPVSRVSLVTVASGPAVADLQDSPPSTVPAETDSPTVTPLHINTPGAVFRVGRLAAGQSAVLPASRFTHVFTATGVVALPDLSATLTEGDAARLTDTDRVTVTAVEDAEILVWSMEISALESPFTPG